MLTELSKVPCIFIYNLIFWRFLVAWLTGHQIGQKVTPRTKSGMSVSCCLCVPIDPYGESACYLRISPHFPDLRPQVLPEEGHSLG